MINPRSSSGSLNGSRRGFSMAESLIALAITTVAGGAILASIGSALTTSATGASALLAQGLADQLLDEIAATRFPQTWHAGLNTAASRIAFDDIDDFDGWTERPPTNRDGRELSQEGFVLFNFVIPRPVAMQPDTTLMSRLTREVRVERIQPDQQSNWTIVTNGESSFRKVTVRVKDTDARNNTTTLVESLRIFSYVPPSP